jgi:ATP-dependent Clp protease adaptor protein ClpS
MGRPGTLAVMSVATPTAPETTRRPRPTVAGEAERPYDVVLWNDPVTLMDVVVRALRRVFGYGPERAELLMMTAHREGKVVVWTGDRDRATRYCVELGLHGLQATIARAA